MPSCLALSRASEPLLLLITIQGDACRRPSLQASITACMLLPRCEARKARFIDGCAPFSAHIRRRNSWPSHRYVYPSPMHPDAPSVRCLVACFVVRFLHLSDALRAASKIPVSFVTRKVGCAFISASTKRVNASRLSWGMLGPDRIKAFNGSGSVMISSSS
jgi:hypothetical protein